MSKIKMSYSDYVKNQYFWKNHRAPSSNYFREIYRLHSTEDARKLALKLYYHNKIPSLIRIFTFFFNDDSFRDILCFSTGDLIFLSLEGDRPSYTKMIIPLLDSTDHRIRLGAIILIGQVGDAIGIDHIIPFTSSSIWSEKLESLYALARIGDDRCLLLFDEIIKSAKVNKHKVLMNAAEYCQVLLSLKLRYLKEYPNEKVLPFG